MGDTLHSLSVTTRNGAYPVYLGDGLTARLGELVAQHCPPGRRFIVSSPLVWKLHEPRVATLEAEPILVPDGERYKTLQTVSRIYDALLRAEADRAVTLVAFGGGVIGDTAGFAAATYLRGVTLVQVPTTLLAQVDSAIGGKVGVNHQLGKNLIGAFYPPALVGVDPALLSTLPRREFRAGLYEVVKYGVIASHALFDRVSQHLAAIFAREPATLMPVVTECCQIKASVVAADEREQGLRRVLNFGHTAGHALEAVTKYRRFRHGEAIAYGMLVAAAVATARGLFSAADREALAQLIVQMGPLPPVGDLSARQVLDAVRRDKKIVRGRLHVVLPTAIGHVAIVDDVGTAELEKALRALGLQK